jgi:pimeloyl-ACP methyl ester carboxylesterase
VGEDITNQRAIAGQVFTGTQAETNPPGPPNISVSPRSVNFGDVKPGSTSNKMVTIQNKGKSDLVISNINITGSNASEFSQTNNCKTIPAGGSCTITVTFNPTLPFGQKSAIVSIPSNDPKKPTVNVKILGNAPPPKISISPVSVNFGSVQVGSTSSPKMVKISNTGKSDLVISNISITGSNASEFSQTNNCTTIPKGNSCTITVTFAPPSAGKKSATMSISSNDPKKPKVNVKLSGNAKSSTSPPPPPGTAPSNVSLIINCEATSTPSTRVTLSISATDNIGVTGYYAAENSTTPSATETGWISVTSATSYADQISFTLSSGDGTKTVYVWFKDAAGNVSEAATDSVILSSETITGQIIYHPPTSERKYSYYHYIPDSALMRDPVRVLLYAHGSGEIDTYPEMEAFIRDQEIYRILPSCIEYGYALVVMVTPRNFSHVYPDYLMNTQNMVRWVMFDNDFDKPEYEFYKRPDLEFVKVIDDFMSFLCSNGYKAYDRVFMTGFSAGGVQSQRFPILHPDKVAATAIGGAPGFLYPVDTWNNIPLYYHVGIYDIGQIPGNSYSLADFVKIPHFIFVGGSDTNDALYHPDMYDNAQSDIIKTYFGTNLQERALMFSNYLSSIGQSTVKIYPGIGHVYTPEMLIDTFTFFDSVPTN